MLRSPHKFRATSSTGLRTTTAKHPIPLRKTKAQQHPAQINAIMEEKSVCIIQHAAQTALGQIDYRDWYVRDDGPEIQPDTDGSTKITKFASNDPEIKNLPCRLQEERTALQMAKESSNSPYTIKRHVDEVRKTNNRLKRKKNLQCQQFAVTEATGHMEQIPSGNFRCGNCWERTRDFDMPWATIYFATKNHPTTIAKPPSSNHLLNEECFYCCS